MELFLLPFASRVLEILVAWRVSEPNLFSILTSRKLSLLSLVCERSNRVSDFWPQPDPVVCDSF